MNVFQFFNTIKEWSFDNAVQLLTEWYLVKREWEPAESYWLVSNSFKKQISELIKEGIDSGKITGTIYKVEEYYNHELCYVTYYDKSCINPVSLFDFITYKLDKKEFAAPDNFVNLLRNQYPSDTPGSNQSDVDKQHSDNSNDVGSLTVKQKREYGLLKQQKVKMGLAIEAAVNATLYIESLEPGTKINFDEDFSDWLHGSGYKEITKRHAEQIWQALPSRNKRPAGNKKKS